MTWIVDCRLPIADCRLGIGGRRCGTSRRAVAHRVAALILVVAAGLGGCSQFIDPNVPEPIRPYVDPEFGGDYLLYQPSKYTRDSAWPLIVVCHSSFPDSPNRRIRAWTQLAEQHGFLVAAPALDSAAGWWSSKGDKQLARQRTDEERILACVRHVRAGHSISDDRVFLHGYSGGAYAALDAGLRHPDVFRAIDLSQPKFDETLLADAADLIDPYQPIHVHYGLDDRITGKDGKRCTDWLYAQGVTMQVETSGSIDPSDMQRAVGFFEDVVRRKPLIRIRALPGPGGGTLDVRFKLHSTVPPVRYEWDFGDGGGAVAAEPVHTYAAAGSYRIIVNIVGPNGTEHRRIATLRLPEMSLGTTRPSPPAEGS